MIKMMTEKQNLLKNILIICGLLFSYFINLVFLYNGLDSLHDFGSFIASGQLAIQGKNPYSIDSPLIFKVSFPKINLEGVAPNLNPPISVLLFQPLSKIDPFQSINFWRILSIILFLLSLFILQKAFPIKSSNRILQIAWAISLAGFWHSIQLGQLYCAMLFITTLVIFFLKNGKFILAGIFLGFLIAIKPNFIFWAFLLLAGGNLRTFVSAGLTALGLSIIPVFVFGVEIYNRWLEASALFTPTLLLFPGNNSFQGLSARFGQPNLGIILSVILGFWLIWYVLRKRPSISRQNSLGLITSLLISPIAWTGYTLVLLPIFFEEREWDWTFKGSAIIFAIPVIFSLVFFESPNANFIIFGWLYGWGLLLLLSGMVFELSIRKDKIAEKTSNIQTN
jgi:alpha-1,2-mannosyltransferase